jgi:hypothetical protein
MNRFVCCALLALCLSFMVSFSLAPSTLAETAQRVTLTRIPDSGIQPEVALDATDVLHMVYFSGEPSAGNVYYVRSTDFGQTFSRPIRVNSQESSAIATGTIRGAQMALGRNGRIHVAWNGSHLAAPKAPANAKTGRASVPMLYSRSSRDGTTFEPQRNLITATTNLDGGGSLTADAQGGVFVAWHGNAVGDDGTEANRRVWIARSLDDGATFDRERPVWSQPTGVCGCCGLRVAASSIGVLHLLYRSATDMTNRDVYALSSTDRGRTFDGDRLHPWSIGACPMTSMFILPTSDRTLGAWETAGQVFYKEIGSGAAKGPATVAAPGEATGRKHPRLAANVKGETLLVWTEGMAWARGGSVAWQPFDRSGRPIGTTGAQPGVPVWSFAAAIAHPNGSFRVFY